MGDFGIAQDEKCDAMFVFFTVAWFRGVALCAEFRKDEKGCCTRIYTGALY